MRYWNPSRNCVSAARSKQVHLDTVLTPSPRPSGENPAGHRTAYLWEKVWARESWLEILGRYLIAQRDKKKQITKVIFPRFHQLDVTRKLQVAVLSPKESVWLKIAARRGGGERQMPRPLFNRAFRASFIYP